MLDDFSAVEINAKKADVSAAGPGRPSSSSTSAPAPDGAAAAAPLEPKVEEDPLSEDDFAKQLQAGMAELMGEIESSVFSLLSLHTPRAHKTNNPCQPEMQAQFESIFKELGAAATASGASSGTAAPGSASVPAPGPPRGAVANPAPSSSAPAGEASFQETIRRTMERMQTSGEQATAAAAAEGSDDFMAELLRQMQAGGGDLGEGGEEEFSKMLLGMMEQLTNKDILYEPMKELNDKFPEWMRENRDKIAEEDRKRYEVQEELVAEIVAKFEEASYSDSNAEHREYIVDRMQKVSGRAFQGGLLEDIVC